MSETGGPVLTPELVLVSPELLAEAQQRQTKRKAAMSSSEPANGTFFVDPHQQAPAPVSPEIAPPPAPSPEPVAAPAAAAPVAAAPVAAQSGPAPSAPMIDVPLGTLIFRAGLLAEEQLEDALQEGMRTGKRLGEVLIERGWLHERDLGRLLAGQKGLPFVEISAHDAEPAALQQLPEEKAKLQVALPLRHEDGQLVVAVADPSNELMLENLRRALGAEPRLVVAPYADLVRSIGEAYGSVPAEAPAPPEPVVAEPVLAQPEVPQPVAVQPEAPQLEVPQAEAQLEHQPEAQLAPPTAPEPAAVEPIQPLTPPAVTPLPTVLPPAEERAPEPVPSPLAPPPPAEPAPPPAAVEETPAVEAPVVPAIETVPPLHEQAAPAPEPVAPPAAVPPAEPEVPAVQPPPAPEPVLQPPVAPPPAAEVPAAPEVPASPPMPVESPVPQAPVQEDEQGAVSVVVLRLRDGDALEIGTFPTAAEAATRAQELVAEIAAAEVNGTWPLFAKRYLRPDSILSVDLVEEDADKWLGSAVRRSWAGQQ